MSCPDSEFVEFAPDDIDNGVEGYEQRAMDSVKQKTNTMNNEHEILKKTTA